MCVPTHEVRGRSEVQRGQDANSHFFCVLINIYELFDHAKVRRERTPTHEVGKRSTQSGKAPEHSSSNILDDAFFMRPSLAGVRVTRMWGEWRMSGLKIIIEKILFAP